MPAEADELDAATSSAAGRGMPVTMSSSRPGSWARRFTVGGINWCSGVRTVSAASIAPDAPRLSPSTGSAA
ncbi:hypothetical protein [Streptomyces roseoverticillatus]|uniref:Uncharacterized protein n=1 Tax=Streptomyces roseoverticillatus TaxID=66429 RepID=A0ABV3IS89_9ACTN